MSKICKVDGCDKKHYAKGYCNYHYHIATDIGQPCSIEGCNKKHYAKGYCKNHYLAYKRKLKQAKINSGKCKINGCENNIYSNKMCKSHYIEKMKNYVRKKPNREIKICSIEGCNVKHRAGGYCNRHYRQYKKYGRVLSDEEARENMLRYSKMIKDSNV